MAVEFVLRTLDLTLILESQASKCGSPVVQLQDFKLWIFLRSNEHPVQFVAEENNWAGVCQLPSKFLRLALGVAERYVRLVGELTLVLRVVSVSRVHSKLRLAPSCAKRNVRLALVLRSGMHVVGT